MSLLNTPLKELLPIINNKIRLYQKYIDDAQNNVYTKMMNINVKKTNIHPSFYNNIFNLSDRHVSDLNDEKKKFKPLLIKLTHELNLLMQTRNNMAPSANKQTINNKIQMYNDIILRLNELLLLQSEVETVTYSLRSGLNSLYLTHSSNSLQGMAAAAIPSERIKKLSPKSRKILKTIIKNTENVYIPNEELGLSPETSPETAAEYVNRTKYAINKRSARSKKRRYKK